MKNKIIKIILIIVLIILIILNIYYEMYFTGFSSNPNDNKIEKITTKYKQEKDEYKFGIIYNCINNMIIYLNNNENETLLNLFDEGYIKDNNLNNYNIKQKIGNITNFTIKEVYKSENIYNSFNYVHSLIEQNNKLKSMYYLIKLDNNNKTYSISIINYNDYNDAKNNKKDEIYTFSINKKKNNEFSYNYDQYSIIYRYINDFYLRSKYNPNEVFKQNKSEYKNYEVFLEKIKGLDKISEDDIIKLSKEINNSSITFNATTRKKNYTIKVKSAMNYTIYIE